MKARRFRIRKARLLSSVLNKPRWVVVDFAAPVDRPKRTTHDSFECAIAWVEVASKW